MVAATGIRVVAQVAVVVGRAAVVVVAVDPEQLRLVNPIRSGPPLTKISGWCSFPHLRRLYGRCGVRQEAVLRHGLS